MALLGGCSAADRADGLLSDEGEDTHGGSDSAESAVNGGGSNAQAGPAAKPPKAKGARSYGTECHKDAGSGDTGSDADAAPPQSCEQLIAAAFPTEGDYPGTTQNVSSEVEACCADRLVATGGMMEHRWDCCANTGSTPDPDNKIGLACTPWGPPVPPSMDRRRRSSQDLEMDGRMRARPPHPDAWGRPQVQEVA